MTYVIFLILFLYFAEKLYVRLCFVCLEVCSNIYMVIFSYQMVVFLEKYFDIFTAVNSSIFFSVYINIFSWRLFDIVTVFMFLIIFLYHTNLFYFICKYFLVYPRNKTYQKLLGSQHFYLNDLDDFYILDNLVKFYFSFFVFIWFSIK